LSKNLKKSIPEIKLKINKNIVESKDVLRKEN